MVQGKALLVILLVGVESWFIVPGTELMMSNSAAQNTGESKRGAWSRTQTNMDLDEDPMLQPKEQDGLTQKTVDQLGGQLNGSRERKTETTTLVSTHSERKLIGRKRSLPFVFIAPVFGIYKHYKDLLDRKVHLEKNKYNNPNYRAPYTQVL